MWEWSVTFPRPKKRRGISLPHFYRSLICMRNLTFGHISARAHLKTSGIKVTLWNHPSFCRQFPQVLWARIRASFTRPGFLHGSALNYHAQLVGFIFSLLFDWHLVFRFLWGPRHIYVAVQVIHAFISGHHLYLLPLHVTGECLMLFFLIR